MKELKSVALTIIFVAISTISISCATNMDSNQDPLPQITDVPISTEHIFPMSVDEFYVAYNTDILGYNVPWTPSVILDYQNISEDEQLLEYDTPFKGYIYDFDGTTMTVEKIDWVTPQEDSTISENYEIRLTDDIQEYAVSETLDVWLLSEDIEYDYKIPANELMDYLEFYESFEISQGFPSSVVGKEIHTSLWNVYLLNGEISMLIENYLP